MTNVEDSSTLYHTFGFSKRLLFALVSLLCLLMSLHESYVRTALYSQPARMEVAAPENHNRTIANATTNMSQQSSPSVMDHDTNQRTAVLPQAGSLDNLSHPHAGALHPNGTMGYIADPTALRRHLQFFLQRDYPDEVDPLSNASHYWELLTNYYPQHRNGSLYGTYNLGANYVCNLGPGQSFEQDGGYKLLTEKIQVSTSKDKNKVLCCTYTHRTMRELSRAQAISWGHKCDGYLAFSTETIPELGLLNILHAGEEQYNNM